MPTCHRSLLVSSPDGSAAILVIGSLSFCAQLLDEEAVANDHHPLVPHLGQLDSVLGQALVLLQASTQVRELFLEAKQMRSREAMLAIGA